MLSASAALAFATPKSQGLCIALWIRSFPHLYLPLTFSLTIISILSSLLVTTRLTASSFIHRLLVLKMRNFFTDLNSSTCNVPPHTGKALAHQLPKSAA